MKPQWKKVKGRECAKTRYPGVWKLKDEGKYWIRARAKNPRTGKLSEISRVVEASPADAAAMLLEELERIRQSDSLRSLVPRFGDYATSLLERKCARNQLTGFNSLNSWKRALEILISFRLEDGTVLGQVFIDKIRRKDLEFLRDELAKKDRAPATTNSTLRVLRVIVRAFVAEQELTTDPMYNFKLVDTSSWRTYTHEQPNSLEPHEQREFLDLCLERYPGWYCFFFLGFVLGQRPSNVTPLRYKGHSPDILWQEQTILIRRSHTRQQEVLERTKTKKDNRIDCGEPLFRVLRWHVDKWADPDSDLLFTSKKKPGSLVAHTTMARVLADINVEMIVRHLPREQATEFRKRCGGPKDRRPIPRAMKATLRWAKDQGWTLPFTRILSLRTMRRSYYVSCDRAEIEDKTARLVSGHASAAMADLYRSQQGQSQRQAVAKVIDLAGVRAQLDAPLAAPLSGTKQERQGPPRNESPVGE